MGDGMNAKLLHICMVVYMKRPLTDLIQYVIYCMDVNLLLEENQCNMPKVGVVKHSVANDSVNVQVTKQ